ncbi:MAG: SCO family protein [Planctomycetes bacterium]|nr:SCO family protein [Planctomycetota bacterium]
MTPIAARRLRRGAVRVRRFFRSWRFGSFAMAAVLMYHLLLIAIMVTPASAPGALGQFAQDFRRWCLDYDDAQGINIGFVIPLFTGPVILGLITLAIYGSQMRLALRRPKALGYCIASAALMVAVVGVGLFTVGLNLGNTQSIEFPAIRLRTHMTAPDFQLTNQHGQTVAPSDFRGQVVVLTAVYARCGATCPTILAQVKRVTSQLSNSELARVRVLAVTLDPEHDTPEVLAGLATGQGLVGPSFHLLTGRPSDVGEALNQMGIQRTWNSKLGMIDHNNVFLVIDRSGSLAYRFSIGDLQERWMLEALQLLLAEPEPTP